VPADLGAYCELVSRVARRLKQGDTVVIHCLAGIGRTGMTAAACLVALGAPASRAIELVRALPSRLRRIETREQERIVEAVASLLRERPG